MEEGYSADSAHMRAWVRFSQARSIFAQGKVGEAVALAEDAAAQRGEDVDLAFGISNNGLLAVAYLRQGRSHAAHQAAEKAKHLLMQSSPTVVFALDGYVKTAEYYLMRCDIQYLRQNGAR